jgi:hypothetical protein
VRLSDIRGCDGCHGLIFQPTARSFFVIRVSTAIVTPAGLEVAAAAARNGVPLQRLHDTPASIAVLGDERPEMMHEIHLCRSCLGTKPLAGIVAERMAAHEARVARGMAS